MRPDEQRRGWDLSLIRYVGSLAASLILMVILVLYFMPTKPGMWKDADSQPFQTHPESNAWRPYTRRLLEQTIAEKKVAIVHLISPSDQLSTENRVTLCQNEQINAWLDSRQVFAFLADTSAPGNEVRELMSREDLEAPPALLLYPPGQSEPTIITDNLEQSLTRILSLIEEGLRANNP